jgi:hypothetical protein
LSDSLRAIIFTITFLTSLVARFGSYRRRQTELTQARQFQPIVVHMTINVFISHAWRHSGHYHTLANWLFTTSWYLFDRRIWFFNKSVPQENPLHLSTKATIRAGITRRIAQSHVVVVPSGIYASHSEWIAFELLMAKQLGKPIVRVDPRGQQRISLIVRTYSDKAVGWTGKSVVNAIIRALGHI